MSITKITELSKQLKPYVIDWMSAGVSVGASVTEHALNGPFHTGFLDNNQAPQFVLRDGSRAMQGDLDFATFDIQNVGQINGVDFDDLVLGASGQILAGAGVTISNSGLIANTPTIGIDTSSLLNAVAQPPLEADGFGQLFLRYDADHFFVDGGTSELRLRSTLGGNGLFFSDTTGVLDVLHDTSLTINGWGQLGVSLSGLAGLGLTQNGSQIDVNAGANLKLSGDTVAVDVPTLAGGGLVSSGTTLQVSPGDGIQLLSGAVAVRAADIAGQGLLATGNDLDIRIGDGLTFDGLDVAIDEAFNFAWTGVHTHAGNVSSSGAATGVTGWTLFPNGNADFREIQADSLTVDAFIADVNLAVAGSEYITKSGATVSRDFVTPSTTATLYVFDLLPDTQNFEAGDTVALRYIEVGTGLDVGWVWGTVSNYVDLPEGEQSWAFTRTSGQVGKPIRAGVWAIDYGTPGDGVIKSTVTDLESPFIDIQTWTGNAYTPANFTTHLRLGKLTGITDPNLNPSGFGLYSDNAYLTGELVLGSGEVVLDSEGMSLVGTQQSAFNTPEKVTWYKSASNRADSNGIGYVQGYHNSGIAENTIDISTWSGFDGGVSRGANSSKVTMRALHENAGGALSDATILDLDTNGTYGLQLTTTNNVLLNLTMNGTVDFVGGSVSPLNDLGADLGQPTKRWSRIYVDEIIAGTTSTTDTGHNHDDRYYLESEIDSFLSGKSDTTHTHSGFATQIYVDSELSGKSDNGHNHNDLYYTEAETDGLLLAKAPLSHNHNDLYYTEAEIDALLATKEDIGHTHSGCGGVSDHSALTGITANDHHNQIHDINGPDHTGTLDWTKVNKTGALLSDLGGTLPWTSVNKAGALLSDLGGTLPWASVDKTGSSINDFGGTLAWSSLNFGGASITDIPSRAHGDLTSVGENDHHPRSHALNSVTDHTGTLDNVQAPQFLLLDGTRPMTGNLINDGMREDLGAYNTPWGKLYVDEIVAPSLVPTNVMATVNGRIMISSSGALTRDLGESDTTLYLDSNAFGLNEYAYLQKLTATGDVQFEVVQFDSGPATITALEEYSYTIIRNLDVASGIVANIRKAGINSMADVTHGYDGSDPDPGDAWVIGDGVVSLRANTGQGFIDLTSTTTITGQDGPTMSVFSRTGSANWNDISEVVAIGNLKNRVDYTSDTFGFAIGDNLLLGIDSFSGLTADPSGLRLFNTDYEFYRSGTKKIHIGDDGTSDAFIKVAENAGALTQGQYGFSGRGLYTGLTSANEFIFFVGDDNSNIELNTATNAVDITGDITVAGSFTGSTITANQFRSQIGFSNIYTAAPLIGGQLLSFLSLENIYGGGTVSEADKYGTRLYANNTFSGQTSDLRVLPTGITATNTVTIDRESNNGAQAGLSVIATDQAEAAITVGSTGNNRIEIWGNTDDGHIALNNFDGGLLNAPHVNIGRNISPTSGSAGYIQLTARSGQIRYLWLDFAGNLRVGTQQPTQANDFSGQVVQLS